MHILVGFVYYNYQCEFSACTQKLKWLLGNQKTVFFNPVNTAGGLKSDRNGFTKMRVTALIITLIF